MAIKKTVVCDNCGSEQNVQKYRIGTQTGSLYTMELCDGAECAGPVNNLISHHQKTSRRVTYKPVQADTVKVIPAKRTARKTPAKKAPASKA